MISLYKQHPIEKVEARGDPRLGISVQKNPLVQHMPTCLVSTPPGLYVMQRVSYLCTSADPRFIVVTSI